MEMSRNFKKIISWVLAVSILSIALLTPMKKANADTGKYVSDVYVAYGNNAKAAKKVLEEKGFTPVEGNLNDGGDAYVMMGYKTTEDIREAVTDIAVMNMDGGFSTTEYSEILRSRKAEVAGMLNDFFTVIKEYRANLRDNKPKAKVIHDVLNKFVDDDTGMKMGDLLNSVTLQDKVGVKGSVNAENPDKLPDLLTIFMQSNTYIINTIESALAIAADTNENTWIDRFAETDYDTLLDELEDERPDLNTDTKRVQYLDNKYGKLAMTLADSVADLRVKFLDYEKIGLDITTATEEDIKDTFGDPDDAENEETAVEISANIMNWTNIGIIYEYLKHYEGGNLEKGDLIDFFLEKVDKNETERYYPMAAAFTDGQRGGMDYVTLGNMIRYTFIDPEKLEKELKSNDLLNEIESKSIYSGINRDLYKTDGSIAYTDAAMRAKNAATPSAQSKDWTEEFRIPLIWWGTTLGAAVVWFTAGYLYVKNKSVDMYARFEDYMDDLGSYIDYEVVATCRLATVVLAIVAAVWTIYTLLETEEIQLKPIPKYFVDNRKDAEGNDYEVFYQAAECNRADYNKNEKQTGDSADICADEGRQWLALYVSKNSRAGKPLMPNFKYDTNSNAPSNMSGNIHMLGGKGATNLAYKKYRNFSKLYTQYLSVKGDFTDTCKAYVFFQLSDKAKTYDESAGNMTASAFQGGMAAVWGFGGLALGAVLGAAGFALINKNKKKKEIA